MGNPNRQTGKPNGQTGKPNGQTGKPNGKANGQTGKPNWQTKRANQTGKPNGQNKSGLLIVILLTVLSRRATLLLSRVKEDKRTSTDFARWPMSAALAEECMPEVSTEAVKAVRRAVVHLLQLTHPLLPAEIKHRRRRGGECVRKQLEKSAPLILTAFDEKKMILAQTRCAFFLVCCELQSCFLCFVCFISFSTSCFVLRRPLCVAGLRCPKEYLAGRPSPPLNFR